MRLRVQPRSSKNGFAGVRAGALKIKLTAPPVEGEANKALITFLSKVLNIKKSALKITSGEGSKDKRVFVTGVSLEDVAAVFSGLLKESK